MTKQPAVDPIMVEAGAAALYRLRPGKAAASWQDLPETTKRTWRRKAEAVLRAAADARVAWIRSQARIP